VVSQHEIDIIRGKVLKALYEKKSPILIDSVGIVQLADNDPEVIQMGGIKN